MESKSKDKILKKMRVELELKTEHQEKITTLPLKREKNQKKREKMRYLRKKEKQIYFSKNYNQQKYSKKIKTPQSRNLKILEEYVHEWLLKYSYACSIQH